MSVSVVESKGVDKFNWFEHYFVRSKINFWGVANAFSRISLNEQAFDAKGKVLFHLLILNMYYGKQRKA